MKTTWRDGDGGQERRGAGLAHRLGVCPGEGCAPDADAGAVHAIGETSLVAHRSGRRPQPARRLGARAGFRRDGREPADVDDPQRLRAGRGAARGAACGRLDPGLSRPLGRRLVRHAGGDGVRRTLRARCELAGGPSARARSSSSSRKSWGSCCRSTSTTSRASRRSSPGTGCPDVIVQRLGKPTADLRVRIHIGEFIALDESWDDLRRAWSETSWRMRRLRDDPQSADEEYEASAPG